MELDDIEIRFGCSELVGVTNPRSIRAEQDGVLSGRLAGPVQDERTFFAANASKPTRLRRSRSFFMRCRLDGFYDDVTWERPNRRRVVADEPSR